MGKRYVDPAVRCPYYCSEEPGKLYCQGVEEKSWIHLAWGDGKRKKKYKFTYCRGDWERCPVAKLNMERENTSGG